MQFCHPQIIFLTRRAPIKKKIKPPKTTSNSNFPAEKRKLVHCDVLLVLYSSTKSLSLNSLYFGHSLVWFQLAPSWLSALQLLEGNGCLDRLLPIFGEVSVVREDQSAPRPCTADCWCFTRLQDIGNCWGGHASGSLGVQAEYRAPALLPILCSLPEGGSQLLGWPGWDYASQKARRPPVSKPVLYGNNVDKSIRQRRIRSLTFLLLTHRHHQYHVQGLCLALLCYIQTFGSKSANYLCEMRNWKGQD